MDDYQGEVKSALFKCNKLRFDKVMDGNNVINMDIRPYDILLKAKMEVKERVLDKFAFAWTHDFVTYGSTESLFKVQ